MIRTSQTTVLVFHQGAVSQLAHPAPMPEKGGRS